MTGCMRERSERSILRSQRGSPQGEGKKAERSITTLKHGVAQDHTRSQQFRCGNNPGDIKLSSITKRLLKFTLYMLSETLSRTP